MNPKIKELRKKAMQLPLTPGVYLMKNSSSEIIYVGKAKALKNRVSQYFGSEHNHTVKVRKMVENVDDFDVILTDSEFEALVLECSLIKQHSPKYNILLKDDKGYSYIKVTPGKWRNIYAVLQREGDEEYYSKHSENGAYYSGGSIFSQDYNQKDFSDPMTVLYGHNLRNGRMFAQLNDFSDAEVFEAHRYIYVYLPDRMLVYEIFAAYPHSNEHLLLCHDFADADDFTAYFDGVQAQKSLQANFRTDAWPEPGDRVLTLSTCFRGDNHQRYLVQGKLVAEAYAK